MAVELKEITGVPTHTLLKGHDEGMGTAYEYIQMDIDGQSVQLPFVNVPSSCDPHLVTAMDNKEDITLFIAKGHKLFAHDVVYAIKTSKTKVSDVAMAVKMRAKLGKITLMLAVVSTIAIVTIPFAVILWIMYFFSVKYNLDKTELNKSLEKHGFKMIDV